jgi:ubiquinone/menaquinone biosynthesis C-methylase UbiE
MLARAQGLAQSRRWRNVVLLRQNAQELQLPQFVNAVLFSLSYSVIPDPRKALAQAWLYLLPGGRVVVLDGSTPTGRFWRLWRRWISLLSRATVLGDPDTKPCETLRDFATQVEREEFQLRTYCICRAIKQ